MQFLRSSWLVLVATLIGVALFWFRPGGIEGPRAEPVAAEGTGFDHSAFDAVLAQRAEHAARFGAFIESLDFAALPETVEIDENGNVPTVMCFHVVLEEEFEHLRYATRDLAALAAT